MKIIFLNRFFFPDESATSQLLADLAFHIVSPEREVHVIASRLRYDDPSAPLPANELVRGVKVHRVWTSRFGRGNLIGRMFDYLTFYSSVSAELFLLVRKGDLVIAKTDPPLLSVFAILPTILCGGSLINWVQDLFPEVAEAAGLKWLPRPISNLIRKSRNWSIGRSARTVVIGERMKEKLIGEGVPAGLISVIPNWADGESIRPIKKSDNQLLKNWGLEKKFVVGYSGNLGRAHELMTVIEAMESLKSDNDIEFLFVGGGKQRAWLEAEVQLRGIANIQFRPYQSRESLEFSLGVADVHLVTLLPEMEGLIVPSKFYGVAAAGRPTLYVGDPDGEIPRILRDARCGIAVRSGDSASLVDSILKMRDDDEFRAELGRNARKVFDEKFDKHIALSSWEIVLAQVAEQVRHR